MTTGKTIALTRRTFVGKISVLFNMLSVFVLALLPGGKHLLISWLQSLSTVNLEPKRLKSASVYLLVFYIIHVALLGPRISSSYIRLGCLSVYNRSPLIVDFFLSFMANRNVRALV